MASLFKPGEDPEISPELQAYYDDDKLVRRNIFWILVMTIGWSISFTVVSPLMMLHLNACGASENMLGMVGTINLWAYSYMVMYFSWKSDRTVTRFGRRIPYLFICVPGIVLSTFLFPFFTNVWVLIGLFLVQLFFTNMKYATIPLLNIDCIPRNKLARMGALISILGGLISFFVMRYGMNLAEHNARIPFYVCAVVATVTSGLAGFMIKEPPVRVRPGPKETFKPWSALKVGWHDKREIFLMLGVGCAFGFFFIHNQWIWLFAKNVLGLSKSDMGSAISWGILISMLISYPAGWVVDKFGSYIILAIFWVLITITFVCAMLMHNAVWLAAEAILVQIASPFYWGIDILVYRSVHPKDIGSVTSSNSFLRGLIGGVALGVSGLLIKLSGGDYRWAFVEGYFLVTLSLVFFAIHWWLKNHKPYVSAAATREKAMAEDEQKAVCLP